MQYRWVDNCKDMQMIDKQNLMMIEFWEWWGENGRGIYFR